MEEIIDITINIALFAVGGFVFWFFAKGFDAWTLEKKIKKFEHYLNRIDIFDSSLTRKDMKWFNLSWDIFMDIKGKTLNDEQYSKLERRVLDAHDQFHEILKLKETIHKDDFEKLMVERRINKYSDRYNTTSNSPVKPTNKSEFKSTENKPLRTEIIEPYNKRILSRLVEFQEYIQLDEYIIGNELYGASKYEMSQYEIIVQKKDLGKFTFELLLQFLNQSINQNNFISMFVNFKLLCQEYELKFEEKKTETNTEKEFFYD